MAAPELKLDTFLPYRLSIASNLVSEVIADSYHKLFGLKIPEWRLLAVIAETDGISQLAIGQRTRMDKVTVSRAALSLQARGLIARRINPEDGRSRLLTLTPSGRTLYAAVVPKARALESEIFKGLDAAAIDAFTGILDRIEGSALAMLGDTD